ncbi:hypothetical protein GCM10017687_86740 [Streptomyces echinatus]
MPRRAAHSIATALAWGGAHHRAHVVLAEDALHGDVLRPVFVQPLLDALLDGEEAVAELRVGGGPDDPDTDHGERTARDPLDDADPAPGQAGVHPQYAHAPLPFSVAGPPPLPRTRPDTAVVPRPVSADRGR